MYNAFRENEGENHCLHQVQKRHPTTLEAGARLKQTHDSIHNL